MQGGKKTKTGTFSTDSGTLENLSDQGYKIAKFGFGLERINQT